ncbi:MAG: hypothetical protein ACKODX_12080 [Gemmata sp.]
MADVPSDPRIAFVADSSAVAEAVIRLLAANDIPAEITTSAGRTTTDPLTGATELAQSDEFPIAITDPEKMEAARELLATAQTMAAVKAVRDKRANRTGTVTATCEDCGKPSDWPAQAMGTTETCPHCHGYMDIPDPDDDWSGVDFGAEDETEPKEE